MGPNTRLQGDQRSCGEPESDSIRPGPGSSANLPELSVSVTLEDRGVYAFIRYVWRRGSRDPDRSSMFSNVNKT